MYAIPRKMTSLMAGSNRILMVIWIVFVGVALVRKLEQRFPKKLSGALVLLLGSLLAYVFAATGNTSIAVSVGLKLLGFLILPIMLIYSAVFEIETRSKTAILITNFLLSLIFIDLYNSDKRYVFEDVYGLTELDSLTLGYPNPNQTAMYLFLCTIGLAVGAFYFKRWLVKAFFAADAVCMAWFVSLTDSRTALVLLVVFALLIWVTGKRAVTGLWVDVALLIPLLYVLVLPLASSVTVMGESMFNGREAIFNRYLGNLSIGSFFLGDMERFRFDNLHNGYVAIAASVGVPACLGYVHLLKTCLQINRPGHGTPAFERAAFAGLLCAIMYTAAEAAVFVGGSNYAMLVFGVYVLFARPGFSQSGRGKMR
jgi:hypothetical protein